MNVVYQADSERLSNAAAFDKITLGIAKFEDKRTWVKKEDPQSESYVGASGPIKFGLTYKETDYTPVKDVVQDILVQEFTKAGFKTRAIDRVLSNSNAQTIKDLSPDQAGDYILGGQILSCEFVNDAGWVTIDSRISATFDIDLFKGSDPQPVMETSIFETQSKEYAMALSLSVSVYNLINEVVKRTAKQIIQKTAEKISTLQSQGSQKAGN
jgi:hypothetical protein